MFFCGHHEDCTPFNTKGALERAKRAVEEEYSVVGVLEDLNTTLTVFENYVPKFFKGAKDVYWSTYIFMLYLIIIYKSNRLFFFYFLDEIKRYNTINRNIFKPPVTEEVKNIVRQNFTREIEFYDFCKQRLHKQYVALKLNSK